MITFTDSLFFLQLLFLIPALFISWYIPGGFFIKKLHLSRFETTTLSLILGIVLWALQGVLFGYMGVRFMTFIYIGVFTLWFLLTHWRTWKKPTFTKPDVVLASITILGIVVQMITVWFIGLRTGQGLEFCCFWPDSFYHLALIGELTKTFPPTEPGMHEVMVRNYHYLANLAVADLVRVFRFSPLLLQYQLLPLVVTGLLASATIMVGRQITKNILFTRLFLFFILFGGDIIFLVLLALGKGLGFELTVSENATTLWFSPPRVYAMVILMGGIGLLLHWCKKPTVLAGILLGVMFGSLVGFKIYLGFFALVGLIALSGYFMLKRNWQGIVPLIVAGFLTLGLYLPVNTNAGGLFYSGFWRIDDFAVRPELGLLSFTLAKQVYVQHHNYLRIFLVEAFFFALYMVCLLGIHLLGFIQTKKSLRALPFPLHLFLLSGTSVCFVIGMFFLQTTGGANTLQFLFCLYITGAFYSSLAISYWYPKIHKPFAVILLILLLVLASGRVVHETAANIRDLSRHEGYYTLSRGDEEALTYLKQNIPANAVILIDEERANEDDCYIQSFVSDRNFYLCGSGILEDHGLDTQKRKEVVEVISHEKDYRQVLERIDSENIEYIYVPTGYLFGTTQLHDVLTSVYNNNTMQLFAVNQEKVNAILHE